MTVVPAPPVRDQPDELEALIREARARQRLRRLQIAAALLALAVVAAIAYGVDRISGGGPGVVRLEGGPIVDVRAFAGHGRLAFVSRDELYLTDGASRRVSRIAIRPGWTAFAPSFSHDGKWITYQTQPLSPDSTSGSPQLWIAHADGSRPRRITGADGMFGWSPSSDVLAISTDTRARFPDGATGKVPTRVELVSPTGARRRLLHLDGRDEAIVATGYRIWNAVWSPDGKALAVSLVSFTRGSIVRSYPIDGSAPTTWFVIDAKGALPGICSSCGGTISDLAGWWPKWGIGFWVYSSGMVHNNDSTPIELVHTPGATPHIIGWTLSDRTTDALAASRTGSLAIVASAGNAGREYGIGKEIAVCNLSRETCTPIPKASTWLGSDPLRCSNPCLPTPAPGKPGSSVSLDPAWSPGQNVLAYVKAPTAFNAGNPPLAWFSAHKLYVYNPSTRQSTEISSVNGLSVPTWSSDGNSLLYVAHNALWLAPATGGKPTEIATPLYPRTQWLRQRSIAYYGQIPGRLSSTGGPARDRTARSTPPQRNGLGTLIPQMPRVSAARRDAEPSPRRHQSGPDSVRSPPVRTASGSSSRRASSWDEVSAA